MLKLTKRILGGEEILLASLNGNKLRRVTIGLKSAKGVSLTDVFEDACLDLALLRADATVSMVAAPDEGFEWDSGWADWMLLHGYSLKVSRAKHAGQLKATFRRESAYGESFGPLAALPDTVTACGPGIAEALAATLATFPEELAEARAAVAHAEHAQ